MTIDTERVRELAAELGFWPATTDEADIEHHRSTRHAVARHTPRVLAIVLANSPLACSAPPDARSPGRFPLRCCRASLDQTWLGQPDLIVD